MFVLYSNFRRKAGGVCVAIDLPTEYLSAPPPAGFLLLAA